MVADLLELLTTLLTIVILLDVLVSFVLDPYHPFRRSLDAIVQPMLAPIRRVLPPVGMLDFSPFVLLVLVQVIGALLVALAS